MYCIKTSRTQTRMICTSFCHM